MRMDKLRLGILAGVALASPALAEMAAAPVAAPVMSPLSLVGLGAVLGVVGVRVLKNRRQS